MDILTALITLGGMAYGAYWVLKYMFRSTKSIKREEPLTPNDLKVLEESAASLISDIRAAADECVAKVEEALRRADQQLGALSAISAEFAPREDPVETLSAADAARSAGLTTGEVELMRGLRRLELRS